MEKKGSVLMEKYELGRLLGQGTFAKVHYGKDLKTGAGVAIKVIDKEKVLKVGLMERVEAEISAMRMIQHPNVVALHEVMASKSKIYLVMEYAKGGVLFNKLTKGRLKPEAARKYFRQLITAVDYCHSRGVAYRDLKPENLLLDEAGDLKVSDFGLSALAESRHEDGLLHTTCGTPAYVAPEVISRLGYDGSTADVWSCGVVLFVLLAGYLPFYHANLMEMYKKISLGDFKVPSWFSPDSRKLVKRMLDPNPRTRVSMERILASSWVRQGLGRSTPTADRGDELGARERDEPTELCHLNAFDIISYSSGFDLSGLFVDAERKREVRFTSDKAAPTIISSLEQIAQRLRLGVKKRAGGLVRLEASKEGRKGLVAIDAEIFEITSSFHLVQMNKVAGDTLEYCKMMNQDIRPALKDIIWSWQGEEQPPPPPQKEELEPPRSAPSNADTSQASESHVFPC